MKQNNKNSIIRKYYIRCIILTMIYVVVCCAYLLWHPGIWSVLTCGILCVPFKYAVRIIANKTLLPAIYVDLNASEFQNIVTGLMRGRNYNVRIDYRMLLAISMGNYQEAVNVATNQIKRKRCSISWKYYFLYHLALIYFKLRDFEKLRLVIDKYDEYNEIYPSRYRLKSLIPTFQYYKSFLDANYEECKNLCLKNISSLKPKAYDTKYRKLNIDLYYAIACYYNNELESARNIFDDVAKSAPNLYISNIAKEFLEAIENDSELKVNNEITPEIDFKLHTKEHKRRLLINRIVLIAWIILFVGCIVIPSVSNDIKQKKYEKAVIEYQEKLNDAVSRNYRYSEAIDYFNINYDGQLSEGICIIGKTNGLDLVSIVTKDNGETFDFEMLVQNIEIEKYHYIKSAVSDYYIGFKIYTKEKKDKDYYHVVNFTYKNTEYWLVIDYIGETPNT